MKIKEIIDRLDNKQLKQELFLYQTMVNASLESITLIDRNYRYCIVSESYLKARHLKKEEILNQTVSDVWGKEVFEQIIKERLDECFKGKIVNRESLDFLKRKSCDIAQGYLFSPPLPVEKFQKLLESGKMIANHDDF